MWILETPTHNQINAILQRKQLTALFQPIVNLSAGDFHAYEGLIRGPSDSMLHSPNTLFKVALETGLRLELELLCHEVLIRSFLDLGLKGRLFLNISPDVLVHLMRRCKDDPKVFGLYKKSLDRDRIVLELTEGDRFIPYTSEELVNAVRQCSDMGFSVAIDDLGEGSSSLRLWSELRPGYVKIDRHFVQNIENDPVKTQFVRSIVEIAQSTQCNLIAEGIETESEMRLIFDFPISPARSCAVALRGQVAGPYQFTQVRMRPFHAIRY